MCFLSNVSSYPTIVAFSTTLIAKNWNPIQWPCSYRFAFYNILFYCQLAFVFHFLEILILFSAIFLIFLRKDFDALCETFLNLFWQHLAHKPLDIYLLYILHIWNKFVKKKKYKKLMVKSGSRHFYHIIIINLL